MKLIEGFLAAADGNGSFSFDISFDNGIFNWDGPPPANGKYSQISRVDFLSSLGDPNPLAVIACVPAESSVTLDSNTSVTIKLALRSLVGSGNIPLLALLRTDGTNLFFENDTTITKDGFSIGGDGSTDNLVIPFPPPSTADFPAAPYEPAFIGLSRVQGSNFDQKWIDIPRCKAAGVAQFESVSGRAFNSDHITFHIRPVSVSAAEGALPLNVLTIRRGYSLGSGEQFPIEFPVAVRSAKDPSNNSTLFLEDGGPGKGSDSNVHSTQFPSIDWLTGNKSSQALDEPSEWYIESSGFTTDSVMALWNQRIVASYIAGLRAVNAPLPISFVPTFQVSTTAPPPIFGWRVLYSVLPNIAPDGTVTLTRRFTRILPGGLLNNEDGTIGGSLPVEATLFALRTHTGSPLAFASSLATAGLADISDWTDATLADGRVDLAFTASGFNAQLGQRVRLGALDFTIAQSKPGFTLGPSAIFEQSPLPEVGWLARVLLQGFPPSDAEETDTATRGLPILSYGPGGQDLPPLTSGSLSPAGASTLSADNFVQANPIVIDSSLIDNPTPPADGDAKLTLYFSETTVSTPKPQQQQIILELRWLSNDDAGKSSLGAVVLDPEPLLFTRVAFNPPPPAADSDSTLVGNWSNLFPEGPGWRLQVGAQGYTDYLPPQAVGEAMVKTLAPDDPHAPIDNPQAPPVEFRFTRAMIAHLLASFSAQNAVQPGWDTRAQFGFAGEREPGAQLDAANGGITFSFFRGLLTTVSDPNLRLSEIFARLGSLPGALPDITAPASRPAGYSKAQIDTYNQSATAWGFLFKQLQARPAVLELSDPDQGADVLIDDDVEVAINDTDSMHFPPGTTQAPAGGTFDGGLGYALDSANIADELLYQPNSVSAQLMQPRFTALGGYGSQRAVFAQGKVFVDTRIAQGRTETITITLVGRIGVLWNHALHVTVFERTVQPTTQFAQEQGIFAGRPLIRKTSEYVEILETSRSYPESSSGNPVTTGFVLGSEFKSTRIPVDSGWGGDVGTFSASPSSGPSGWQVPLWNPKADPDIYPRPHIALIVAVDPALGVDSVHSEIADPQKLCFFTDTSTNANEDTDAWAPLSGIDFTLQQAFAGLTPIEGQDPSVVPGFGNFTYNFISSPIQINLAAKRTTQAIGARLTSSTMMRGNTQASAPSNDNPAARLKDWLTAAGDFLKKPGPDLQDPDSDTLQARLTSVQNNYLNKLQGDLSTLNADPCKLITSRLSSGLNRANQQGGQLVNDILVEFPQDLLNTLESTTADTAADLVTLLDNKIDAQFTQIRSTLAPLVGDLSTLNKSLNTYNGALSDFSSGVTNIQKDLASFGSSGGVPISQLINEALALLPPSVPAGNLRSAITSAAAVASQGTAYILGSLSAQLVLSFDPALDDALTALSQLPTTTATIPQDILAALNSGLNSLANAVQQAGNVLNTLSTPIGNSNSSIDQFLQEMQDGLKKAIANAAQQTIDQIKAAVTDFFANNHLSAAADIAAKANALIKQQTDDIAQLTNNLCSAVTNIFQSLQKSLIALAQNDFLNQVSGAITGGFDQFKQAVDQASGQFEDQLNQFAGNLIQQAAPVAGVAGEALRLIRAFGEPPQVPTLSFASFPDGLGLSALAYAFDDTLPYVNMTSALAGVQQVASSLQGALSQMGLSVPTSKLADRFLPGLPNFDLSSFDLNKVFPKFAGIDLSSLFSGIKVPDAAQNAVRVTHQVDPQTKRASLDADISFPLPSPTTLLSIGPVTLQLLSASFDAHVHCAAAIGQQITQTSSGEITASWQVSVGGMAFITFNKTSLTFDSSGHLSFSVSPANIQLAAVLQFLADIINSFDFGDSGFSLHATSSPVHVQSILNLPLPDMSGGVFGIRNLVLGALFELGLDKKGFFLGVGGNLGRQSAPADLTVFVLGGALSLESYFRYQNSNLTGQININIDATAALAISLGPISGSISIYFGIFAILNIGSGGGFQLGIMLLFDGRVSVLGIIDADISLLLEAEYSSGGGLLGRGVLSISIKICWCFTLSISKSVEYTFGAAGGGGGGSSSPQARISAPISPQSQNMGVQLAKPMAITAGSAPQNPVAPDVDPNQPLAYADYYNLADAYITMLA